MKYNNNTKSKLFALLIFAMSVVYTHKLYSQTELYNKYEYRTDLTVACAMQYPLIDTIKTDITLFIPQSKESLWPMLQEFNVMNVDRDTVDYYYENDRRKPIIFYSVHRDDIKKRYGELNSAEDYRNVAILVYNYNNGVILIIHDVETQERGNAIISFLISTAMNQKTLPTKQNK